MLGLPEASPIPASISNQSDKAFYRPTNSIPPADALRNQSASTSDKAFYRPTNSTLSTDTSRNQLASTSKQSDRAFPKPTTTEEAFVINYRPIHIDTKDALDFASMKIKDYYNSHYQSIFFKVSDLVKLYLYRGYKLPGVSKKLEQQFARPFQVLERIGKLAYRLQLPANIRIYNVVLVAQLKPTSDPAADLYRRRPPPLLTSIIDGKKEDKIDHLVRKRIRHLGRLKLKTTEYLARWAGYSPEYDTWITVKQLAYAKDLIDDFEASQKEAVIQAVPKGVAKAIAVVLLKASKALPSTKSATSAVTTKALPSTKSATSATATKALPDTELTAIAVVLPKPSTSKALPGTELTSSKALPSTEPKSSKAPPGTEGTAIAVVLPKPSMKPPRRQLLLQ